MSIVNFVTHKSFHITFLTSSKQQLQPKTTLTAFS